MIRNSLTLLILISVAFGVQFLSYPTLTTEEDTYQAFSINKAKKHVEKLSSIPGFVGSNGHIRSQKYIVSQLQKLGLEVKLQKTTALISGYAYRSSPVTNIIARIKGTKSDRPALLLMSHYDDAVYSSPGAADAASGVAVILETLRTFVELQQTSENDIIVLITDAEELGLLGAYAFAQKHSWAQDVGVALNFEARGSAGPAYMLLETNSGTQGLINAFKQAQVPFPVANSLAYEIYKALPNDTDMSALLSLTNIQGYNFAFIDNHFNYHTQQDTVESLSLNSLAHQATYATHLFEYLKDADLEQLQSTQNLVYFSVPVLGVFDYSESFSFVLILITALLGLIIIAIAFVRKNIYLNDFIYSFLQLMGCLLVSVGLSFLLIKGIRLLHPEFSDIRQGFPYNGYWYMYGMLLLGTVSTALYLSTKVRHSKSTQITLVPIIFWLGLCLYLNQNMPGAGYLIMVPLGALILFTMKLYFPKLTEHFSLLIILFPLVVISPLLFTLPVALGLDSVWMSVLIIVFFLAAYAPILSDVKIHKTQLLWLLFPLLLFVQAERNASFDVHQPQPSSLAYWMDLDTQEAYWLTYNHVLTPWNSRYFDSSGMNDAQFKEWKNTNYQRGRKIAVAPSLNLESAKVKLNSYRTYSTGDIVDITVEVPQQTTDFRVLAQQKIDIQELSVNSQSTSTESKTIHQNRPILRHFMGYEKTVNIRITLAPGENMSGLTFLFNQPTLLNNKQLQVSKRPDHEIPMAFTATDVITLKQSISLANQ